MEWLWLIPILFFLVLTHEFGHFITARLFNVTVHEFGIGFPPKAMILARRNGVEYTLNWLPLGGFVRMEGEEGDSNDPNAFNKKPAWQRLIILAAGSLVNLLTALVIFIGLNLGGADVPKYQTAIYSLEPGGPAQQAGLQPGDIILQANDKPVNTYQDLQYVVTLNANTRVNLTIQRNGQQQVIAVVPRSVDPNSGHGATGIATMYIFSDLKIDTVFPNTPAAQLGLQAGDVITAINNKPVQTSYDVIKSLEGNDTVLVTVNRNGKSVDIPRVPVNLPATIVSATDGSAEKQANLQVNDVITKIDTTPISNRYDVIKATDGKTTVNVEVERGSNTVTLTNVPVAAVTESELASFAPWIDGLPNFPVVHVDYSLGQAIGAGFSQTGDNVGLIFNSLKAIFQGSQPLKNLSGPIGIGKLTAQVAQSGNGFAGLLQLMGLLGANLFFVNMLPIPALDGGRFLFVLIELLSFGRRIPPRIEVAVNAAGMLLLLIFIAYVSFYDVLRTWFNG